MEGMFHRRRMTRRHVIQDRVIARRMTRFFGELPSRSPEMVAREYGRFLLNSSTEARSGKNIIDSASLLDPVLFRRNSRSRYSICLATDGRGSAFNEVTKRAALVSDTIILTHHLPWGQFHDLGVSRTELSRELTHQERRMIRDEVAFWSTSGGANGRDGRLEWRARRERFERDNHRESSVGMFCPDLRDLGSWILAAEPILKAGLACYLPRYSLRVVSETLDGRQQDVHSRSPYQAPAVDLFVHLLVRNRRAVETSGVEPLKTRLVRPVLRMDLPFIDGVSLREFSDITVGEFASYSAFRDFLRQAFLDLDEGMNAVDSDRELLKIGLQIKDQVRATRSAMERSRRKRAVAATGAAIGSVGAILVAVYGPALASAVAALGASGGVWGIINSYADNDIRSLKQNSWFYVWTLAKASRTHI